MSAGDGQLKKNVKGHGDCDKLIKKKEKRKRTLKDVYWKRARR